MLVVVTMIGIPGTLSVANIPVLYLHTNAKPTGFQTFRNICVHHALFKVQGPYLNFDWTCGWPTFINIFFQIN
jgi:peptide methionine sulfoxide reductase MsrB